MICINEKNQVFFSLTGGADLGDGTITWLVEGMD
jgi:hypothetical protein